MRPKSMATVVVPLRGTAARSSMPSDWLVTSASVRSGMISETVPTRVVLPTPKPPATTIFVEAAVRESLERAKSTERPFDQVPTFGVRRVLLDGRLHPDLAELDEVGEQHPDDPDGHRHERGDLGHRAAVADLEDAGEVRLHRAGAGRAEAAQGRLDGQLDA